MQETANAAATTTAANEEPIPGVDALGFGYDVRDQYASAVSIKLPIIDVGPATTPMTIHGQTYLVPANMQVTIHDMSTSNYDKVTGQTIDSYRSCLNINTKLKGDYKFFSGSLAVDFDKEEVKNSEAEFSTIRNVIDLWTLNLPDVDTLTVIPTAQADIDGTTGMAPIDVLKKYGSHFIWEGVIGGRADYSSATDKMTFNQSYDLGIVAEMSYQNAVGSISASNETKYSTQISAFNTNSRINCATKGGDPTLGSLIRNGDFEAWVNSVPNQPVLIDFTQSSLVPIWNLCRDPSRQQQFQEAFSEYMASTSRSIVTDDPILEVTFTDEMIFAGSDHDSGAEDDLKVYKPACSENFYWVGQYAQGNDNPPTGTSIVVKSLTKGAIAKPTGYEKVWDNTGGKGKYCYSCWRPVPPVGYVALGYIMRLWVKDQNPPSGSEVDGLVCVHESLVVKSEAASDDIWNDHGTHANEDCSIYDIIPIPTGKEPNGQTTGIVAGTFYGQGYSTSYNPNPTHPQVYCLDRTKVSITNPDEEPTES